MKNVMACVVALFVLTFLNHGFAAQAMPVNAQALSGVWTGSNGHDTLTLMFQGNACVFDLNGQKLPGIWNLSGNRLFIQFQNGKSIAYTIALENNTLILDGNIFLNRQGQAPSGHSFGGQSQGGWASPLEGTWSVQIPQGKRSFRFTGNTYAQLLNDEVIEEGTFSYTPDGRFQYQVTRGQYQGQWGEDRITISGNSITVAWPDGTVLSFQREGQWHPPFSSPQTGPMTPLEGRWIWAKQGPISFGYIFSGHQYVFFWNGAEKGRGTFAISGMQLTMHHQTGPDAGKTDVLGFQLRGNRLLIFTSDDPNVDPIPFVRQ